MSFDYYEDIVPQAMERHKIGNAYVIPIYLRPVAWQNTPLANLAPFLPSRERSVTEWRNRDEAFLTIAEGIRKVALQLKVTPEPSSLPQTTLEPAIPEVDRNNQNFASVSDNHGGAQKFTTYSSVIPNRESNNWKRDLSYLTFELTVENGTAQKYPVVARSPVGEARAVMHFPFDEQTLENQLLKLKNALLISSRQYRRIALQEEQVAQEFGQMLFRALFTEKIYSLFVTSKDRATQQAKGLRVKLILLSPTLASLPWEFLYDESKGDYLCLSLDTPIVRSIELPLPLPILTVLPPLRILGVVANPKDFPALDVEIEQSRIKDALEDLEDRGIIQITWVDHPRWRDIQQRMRRGPWHILHFIGHGGFDTSTDEGFLVFENDDQRADLISATSVGRLLADHHDLRLVILNSCDGAHGSEHDIFSSTAAHLIRRNIPAVLAMQYAITDQAAKILSEIFYAAIADNYPIEAAISEARTAVSLDTKNTLEWVTPVLYLRSFDGKLFNINNVSTGLPIQGDPTGSSSSVVPGTAILQDSSQSLPLPSTQPIGVQLERGKGTANSLDDNKPGFIRSHLLKPPMIILLLLAIIVVVSALVASMLMSKSGSSTVTSSNKSSPSASTAPDQGCGNTRGELRCYNDHAGQNVFGVSWSPGGASIASGGYDNKVQIWNPVTGTTIVSYANHHERAVTAVAWSPDGTAIASASYDGTVQVWNILGVPLYTYRGHTPSNEALAVAWSPDSKLIASGSADGTAQVWVASTGKTLTTYKGHIFSDGTRNKVNAVKWSPDGKRIASGSNDKTVQIWDVQSGQTLRVYREHPSFVLAIAWSPDGKRIASSGGGKVSIWNPDTGISSLTFAAKAWSVAWSPSSKFIVIGTDDGTVQELDTRGSPVFTFQGPGVPTYAVAWSLDGTRIAAGNADGTVRVWQVAQY